MESTPSPRIRVRAIRPDFSKNHRHFWFDANPFSTHLINALSLQFPPGEAMFVKSVQVFRDKVDDPLLRQAIRAFAAQESLHSKYHDEFNRWLAQISPKSQVYAERIAKDIYQLYARQEQQPLRALAITVALEHMTAIMARTFLRREDILAKIDPQVRALLIWHAIEEIEHRAVAFDVFVAAGGSYGQRVWALLLSSLGLFLTTAFYQFKLVAHDGQLWNLRALWQSLSTSFGRRGFFTQLWGAYLDFYRRDFHPLQHSDDDVIEVWSQRLQELVPVELLSKSDRGTQLASQ